MTGPLRVEIALGPEVVEAIAQWVLELTEGQVATRTPTLYVTVAEAAELLRCRRGRVDNLLSQGRLTRVKDGGRTLIARAELDTYLAGDSTGPTGQRRGARR